MLNVQCSMFNVNIFSLFNYQMLYMKMNDELTLSIEHRTLNIEH